MFSTVAAAGLQIASGSGLTSRNQFILAVSLGLGIGVSGSPQAVAALHQGLVAAGLPSSLSEALRVLMESGMAMGTLTAAILNWMLPVDEEEAAPLH